MQPHRPYIQLVCELVYTIPRVPTLIKLSSSFHRRLVNELKPTDSFSEYPVASVAGLSFVVVPNQVEDYIFEYD